MQGLDILQKITAVLYFAMINFLFFRSLIARKKISLGSLETTIIPGILGVYLIFNVNFVSTGLTFLQIFGFALFIFGSILGAITFPYLGYTNSDDFWFGRKESKERTLVTNGPYKYVRHPIFIGLLIQYLGLTIIFLHPITAALWLFALVFGVYTSINEEKFMASLFPEYKNYAQRTGRFFPKNK